MREMKICLQSLGPQPPLQYVCVCACFVSDPTLKWIGDIVLTNSKVSNKKEAAMKAVVSNYKKGAVCV